LNLKRNFALLFGSKGTAILIGLLTAGIINRALGPFGRGIYAKMLTWIAFFAF
jgi:O-antigen/teichoic acid export membrane protein